MEYRYSEELLQRLYQVFKKNYNVKLTKEECDECLDDFAKLYIILAEEDEI